VPGRRRLNHSPARAHASDRTASSTAHLASLVATLQETIDELKTDILMLTRKVVSLEAELDHVQGKRAL
jgi:hypothetical protein